jgi:hypothetical protein
MKHSHLITNTVKPVFIRPAKGKLKNGRTQDRVLLNTGLIIILHHLYLLCTYFLTPCVGFFFHDTHINEILFNDKFQSV